MSTLAEFLLARIAEDKELLEREDRVYGGGGEVWTEEARARVLAECEAKRRIVEQYEHYRSTIMAYRSPRWHDAMNDQDKQNWHQAEARHAVAEDFVRLLALPYADHPDMPKDPSQPEG